MVRIKKTVKNNRRLYAVLINEKNELLPFLKIKKFQNTYKKFKNNILFFTKIHQ